MKQNSKADINPVREVCRAKINQVAEGSDYDFEAVAVPSENRQLRYSWDNDEYFYEVLKTDPENIQIARMESGLPLFDNHPFDTSAVNLLGITVGYEFTSAGIVMRAKFGARADEALKSDVRNGIVKTVSIEGSILKYTVERKQGEIPIYYADLWEPESLSFAPVPQDILAQIEVRRALDDQIERSKEPSKEYDIINSLFNKF